MEIIKETTYTNICDSVKITLAKQILSSICPQNSEVINAKDVRKIVQQLDVWLLKLCDTINTEE